MRPPPTHLHPEVLLPQVLLTILESFSSIAVAVATHNSQCHIKDSFRKHAFSHLCQDRVVVFDLDEFFATLHLVNSMCAMSASESESASAFAPASASASANLVDQTYAIC